ncbi:hypothetical protein [Thaumasiovibrio subtropicus]|uniref:hypothetical protein n=1 Tax=Thaumasiovibrio subtropicus TaxID=1891207 RepID=UPI000B35CB2D|nr:hypothetical protein [Thaumasiovibrio subtropicus]
MIQTLQKNILWVDGIAAMTAGLLVLILSEWLEGLYRLPLAVIYVLVVANLSYAAYSLSLAYRRSPSLAAIQLLVFGNLLWSVICVVILVYYREMISIWGFLFVTGEALFVCFLAGFEWRWREVLTGRTD